MAIFPIDDMSPDSRYQQLIEVLCDARALLEREDNDFTWSSWEDSADALREVDSLVARIDAGEVPHRSEIDILFLPTGPMQEVSLSSGWGDDFLRLADRFDAVIERVYSADISHE